MDLLRVHCFPKERQYLLELATWYQKMGFACIAIIERPQERRRLTDQIGCMIVPDMCVVSTIDCYISDTFTEDHKDAFKWMSSKDKSAYETQRADHNGPRACPAQHPLTIDSVPATIRADPDEPAPDDVITEDRRTEESRTEENIVEGAEPGTPEGQSEAGEELADNTSSQTMATPVSLCALLKMHGRLLFAAKKLRSVICKRATSIDILQQTIPIPFVPLYNKAYDEAKDYKKKIRRQMRRLAYRVHRYFKLMEKEKKIRQQIYQNLLHVTPLQILLLGHLPRDQQMALLDVITHVRKFSLPILLNRFHEIHRAEEIERLDISGYKKIQI